jgi:hypothetical protein
VTKIGNRKSTIGKRARSTLVWAAITFLALQAGMIVAIELWLPEFRDPFFSYKAQRLQARTSTSEKPVTVLMIGSSRTAYGLEASALEARLSRELGRPVVAFNFGVPASGPITEALYFRRLLARGIRPDLLLIEVLPPVLDGKNPVPGEANWFPPTRLWLKEFALVQRYDFPVQKMCRAWWQAWPVPWFSHRFAILSRVAPAWLPYKHREDWGRSDDDSGWAPRPGGPPTADQYRRAVAHAHLEYAPFLKDFRIGGPACRALRETLELCRSEGIRTALVLMPEGPCFRSWYPPEAWVQIQGFLTELSVRFDTPLINARQWLPEDSFSDSHHLMTRGAAAFTERLGRETLRLLRRHEHEAHVQANGRNPSS